MQTHILMNIVKRNETWLENCVTKYHSMYFILGILYICVCHVRSVYFPDLEYKCIKIGSILINI